MRERTSASGGERERREELERLQVELRDARASLATVQADTERAVAALSAAVGDAQRQRDAASQRLEALRRERTALKAERAQLDERLVEKRKEDAILARGAKLRDRYVDWNPGDREYSIGDGYTASEVGMGALFGSILLVVFLVFVTCT